MAVNEWHEIVGKKTVLWRKLSVIRCRPFTMITPAALARSNKVPKYVPIPVRRDQCWI
jgi:hypothetical protein